MKLVILEVCNSVPLGTSLVCMFCICVASTYFGFEVHPVSIHQY